jgi:ABC-type antimicrobial peptide transport system permease subunit
MKNSKRHTAPPRLAEKLLLWFLKDELAEEVLGDLDEKFYSTAEKHSTRKAKRNYWFQVINYMRPFAFRFLQSPRVIRSNSAAMFKHNLLISYRSFLRFKGNFFINLIGLSSGLACTLLIYLWVNDELSFDKFHEKDDRIYRVLQNDLSNGEVTTMPYMPGLLGQVLKADLPEVEETSMVIPPAFYGNKAYISADEKFIQAQEQYIEPGFLEIFSFPLIEGDPKTALDDKFSVLISEDMSVKLFNTTEGVIGETVHFDDEGTSIDYIVSGVFENVPTNSTQQFDVLLNYQLMLEKDQYIDKWYNSNPYCYVLLKEGANADEFNVKIKNIIKQHHEGSTADLFIQKSSDAYLFGDFKNGVQVGGRIEYVKLFSLVAVVILVIACINFMNLSTAKATTRIKEIGVKKALGARRKTLVGQYYIESFLLTILGTFVALFITFLALPSFGKITGKSLSMDLSQNILLGLIFIVLFAGTLAGSYPALYLSKFKTTESLKGKFSQGFKDIWARKGLVILQLMVSIILIISVLVVSGQIEYIQSANLGYQRDNVLYFDNNGLKPEGYEAFQSLIKDIPGITRVTTTGHDLTGENGHTSGLTWPGKTTNQDINFMNLEMGVNFIETVGIELIQGRSYSTEVGDFRKEIIFNETAIRMMGLEDPIGKTIQLWGKDKKIIGIVKDFRAQSMYDAIEPTFIQAYRMAGKTMVKIQAGTEQQSLAQLQSVYEEYNPGFPFQYKFVDEDYQAMYQSELRVASLSKLFSLIAILITCLGLLGLTAFSTERRSKEIGIRKVLGSGSWRIVLLLTSEFTKMALLALVVALPIGYIISHQWLSNFADSIVLNAWYFIFTAMITLLVTLFTSGSLTIKAAISNPVKSLRSE